jgi:hypothetical protein
MGHEAPRFESRRPWQKWIPADEAAAAITTAGRFINTITQVLPPGLTLPHGSVEQP